jgi:hypothetical protein
MNLQTKKMLGCVFELLVKTYDNVITFQSITYIYFSIPCVTIYTNILLGMFGMRISGTGIPKKLYRYYRYTGLPEGNFE